jgi:demethylmenaquinone methyltransferase/2-methoxy-6-polyprenyl-1,4-benzoquinol methylase
MLPAEKRDPARMRQLFRTVAPRYDFITRTFSYGMDARWKRIAVKEAGLRSAAVVLDLACGTGDFSRLVRASGCRPVGADLTFEMVRGVPSAVCADALHLPFDTGRFDAVFAGYGVRNFPDLRASLREIRRVLRSGGILATLDFFLPPGGFYRPLYLGYLYVQGALWGTLLHGRPDVYTYIPRSLRSFVTAAAFEAVLRDEGYRDVRCRNFVGGGIAVHWATRE